MRKQLARMFIFTLILGFVSACSTARDSHREGASASTDRGAASRGPVDDAALTSKVKAKLLSDDMLNALKIDVDTQNGVVFLSGVVDSAEQKRKAIDIAKRTEGVRDVEDNLKVGRLEGSSMKPGVPRQVISFEDIG
jgi:hyperosmotically inducible protein